MTFADWLNTRRTAGRFTGYPPIVKTPKTSPAQRAKATTKKAAQRRKADAGLVTETIPITVSRDDRDEAIHNFAMSPEMHADTPEVRRAIRTIRANGGEVDPKSKATILAFWLDEQLQRWKKCPGGDGQG